MSRIEHLAEGVTLHLGDCREILPTLPKVDAVVTDPPYGIGADKNLRANKRHGAALVPSRDYGEGSWDDDPVDRKLLQIVVAKARNSIIWGGNYFEVDPSSCWLVWDKENGTNGYADCELAWTNLPQAVRRIKWRWMGMLQQDMANKEDRFHPTQKPIEVMRWCIGHLPDEAKIILDPFMGSGTTGVAAVKLGRKFVGIEIEPKYLDIASRRISEALKQPDMFIERPKPATQQNLFERPKAEADDDFSKSLEYSYDHIRNRVKNGGKRGWMGEGE